MMFKFKNKLLALISTHIIVCALSVSEDNSSISLDYNQQEHSSSVNDNQYTNKVTSNALNIRSYILLMVLLLVVLSLCSPVGLALYKNFYPTSTTSLTYKKIGKTIVLIIFILFMLSQVIMSIFRFVSLLCLLNALIIKLFPWIIFISANPGL